MKSCELDPFQDPVPGADVSQHRFLLEDGKSGGQHCIPSSVGQIASCVAELCARQHRTHCFSISIYGPTARLIRWDRSGAIVSRSFDYHDRPEWLCQFLWRYSQASETERGYDMSIEKASPEEEAAFVRIIIEHVKEQARPSDDRQLTDLIDDHYEKNKVYKVALHPQQPPPPKKRKVTKDVYSDERSDSVPSFDIRSILQNDGRVEAPCKVASSGNDTQEDTGSSSSASSWDVDKFLESSSTDETKASSIDESDSLSDDEDGVDDSGITDDMQDRSRSKCRKYTAIQHFLVSRPVVIPLSASGRATRGYWAVKVPDSITEEADYQVAFLKDTWRNDEDAEKEGEIMVELVEADVPHVSDIFCHGDVVQEDVGGDIEADMKCEDIILLRIIHH